MKDSKRKKIVMFVYGDITTDARVQRAASTLSKNYELILLSNNWGKTLPESSYKNILIGKGSFDMKNYFMSILQAYKIVKNENPDVFYGHDYYSALLVKLLLGRKHCKKVVYDAHELYIPQPGIPFTTRSRFFYKIEKSIVKKVDMMVCANQERANKMMEHYGLKNCPTPIRNISQLKVNDDSETSLILDSLEGFFNKPGITVVYAGVVTTNRKVDDLASAVCVKPEKYKLLIVGKGNGIDKVKQIVEQTPSLATALTGAVPYKSLGAILTKCDIGYIYYPVDTLNNIYCASNKLYEYASVGLPMLSNENPTIKHTLETYGLGVATTDFQKGLDILSEGIDTYKENCQQFTVNNQWYKEGEKLLTAIDELCKTI